MEGDVKPARIPAPLNITQIGGYINLMEQLKKEIASLKTKSEE